MFFFAYSHHTHECEKRMERKRAKLTKEIERNLARRTYVFNIVHITSEPKDAIGARHSEEEKKMSNKRFFFAENITKRASSERRKCKIRFKLPFPCCTV